MRRPTIVLAGNTTETPNVPGHWQIREMDWWRDPEGREQRGPILVFGCPNGRGSCAVPIAPSPANSNRCTWSWDGDREQPTLSPSINCVALDEQGCVKPGIGCGWHGFLSKGMIR